MDQPRKKSRPASHSACLPQSSKSCQHQAWNPWWLLSMVGTLSMPLCRKHLAVTSVLRTSQVSYRRTLSENPVARNTSSLSFLFFFKSLVTLRLKEKQKVQRLLVSFDGSPRLSSPNTGEAKPKKKKPYRIRNSNKTQRRSM